MELKLAYYQRLRRVLSSPTTFAHQGKPGYQADGCLFLSWCSTLVVPRLILPLVYVHPLPDQQNYFDVKQFNGQLCLVGDDANSFMHPNRPCVLQLLAGEPSAIFVSV